MKEGVWECLAWYIYASITFLNVRKWRSTHRYALKCSLQIQRPSKVFTPVLVRLMKKYLGFSRWNSLYFNKMSITAQSARQAIIPQRPNPCRNTVEHRTPEPTVPHLIMQALSVHASMQLRSNLMHQSRVSPVISSVR